MHKTTVKPLYIGHPCMGCSELAAIQKWPNYKVYFQLGGPLWDIIRWLF